MMSRTALTIAMSAGLVVAIPHHATAQTGFNGVITFAIHSDNGKSSTLIQTTSGNKIMLQSGDSGGTAQGGVILNGDAQTMTMMMPGQQKYMRFTEQEMQQRAAMMGGGMGMNKTQTPTGSMSLTNTGRTEVVAGVTCEIYQGTVTDAHGKSGQGSVCVAQGVGLAINDFYNQMTRMGGGGTGAANSTLVAQTRDLLKGGKGILKVTEIKNGQPSVLIVATKIDRTPPSSSVFEPPAGYTQMQMPAMPAGGMPGGMPGGMKPPG